MLRTYATDHSVLQPGDIVRHPHTGTTGKVISIGYRAAKVRRVDMTLCRVAIAELIPATEAQEAEFYYHLAFGSYAIDGDVVLLPDGSHALVLERGACPTYGVTGEWLYVAGLFAGANIITPVLGRDYWLDWVPANDGYVVEFDDFETDVNQVLDYVLGREQKTAIAV